MDIREQHQTNRLQEEYQGLITEKVGFHYQLVIFYSLTVVKQIYAF